MGTTYSLERLEIQIGDLVERHEARRSLDEFRKYADDPVGFIRHELKGEPWSRQIEIAEAVRENRLVTVRAGNGLGKDWQAARLALWWVYCRGGLALVTGPTERQVKEVVMGEVRRAFAAARTLPGELFELALRLDRTEHAGILAFTSNDASKLTGFHAPAVMVVITEAQGVEGYTWEGALSNTTGENSRILAVGNPLRPVGRFYQVSRSKIWKSLAIDAHEHPNVIEQREVIPGAVTQSFIDTMAAEYGSGSGVYQSRVLGEFPEDADEVLVPREWLKRSAERWRRTAESLAQPVGRLAFSLDPARYGPDYSALVVRQGRHVHALITWAKVSTMETTGKLLEAMRSRGITRSTSMPRQLPAGFSFNGAGNAQGALIVVDEVGIGSGVVDRMREQGWEVDGFNGGSSPQSDPDRFANRRAEALWTLRKRFEDEAIDCPEDEALWEELTSIRWGINSAGKIQIEAKDLTRETIGRSPDRADALAMSLSGRESPPPNFYSGISYPSDGLGSRWTAQA